MCVNFEPPNHQEMSYVFGAPVPSDLEWPGETYQDCRAPIVIAELQEARSTLLATFGMIPKSHMTPHVKKFSTMNARAETVGQLRSYKSAWHDGRLCLAPMRAFYEPNWETGSHVRWRIGMKDQMPFAVACIWRAWQEADGQQSHSFAQLTINADDHPLMRRFHRPNDEKRSLVIVPASDYDAWLNCRDPEMARSSFAPIPPS